jgi:L-asparaginase II
LTAPANPDRSLNASGSVELAVLERNGLPESRHLGAAVVTGPDGSILRSLGAADALIYPRSSLKLLQAIAVLRSGVDLTGVQLVLAAASHSGTPAHETVVEELLAAAGLGADALQCPIDWPLDRATRDALVAASGERSRILMNCSGKHASFLLACVHNGWPIETYLDHAHPLQQLIRETVEELTEEPVLHSGIDGCGAPLHAVTLAGLGRAVSHVARSADEESARLVSAILEHPWALDGPGRANTVAIEELGVIAKGGAEGVMVMGAADGTSVALKVLDGSMRATTLVAVELLARAGAVERAAADRVIELTTERVLGRGEPVGVLRATV